MELQDIAKTIIDICSRLTKSQTYLYKLAKQKSEAERCYRLELARELIKLRAEGTPVAIVSDIARGNVSELRFNRDLTDAQYRSAIEAIDSLKAQLNALQSLLKHQIEI
jgi:hypothetical protein